jgi:hypothetical protein
MSYRDITTLDACSVSHDPHRISGKAPPVIFFINLEFYGDFEAPFGNDVSHIDILRLS